LETARTSGVRHHRARGAGFTLIELMIVVVLVGLLAILGVPAFRTQVLNSQMTAATNELLATLSSARNEAVGRQNFVSVCPRNVAGDACSGSNWDDGWIMFSDPDADATADTGEEILFALPAFGGEITIRGTAQVASGLTFRPSGASSLTSTQTYILCDERGYGDLARSVIITRVGHTNSLIATDATPTTCTP
jgi:type IV fimbrial biogenesis protein FimT